jgi:hypothetical protein
MGDFETALEFDEFDYAENNITYNIANNDAVIEIWKTSEYTASVLLKVYKSTYSNVPMSQGHYYKIVHNVNPDNIYAFGTLEDDIIPDIISAMNVANYFNQTQLYIQLDKLDPEKFPLFFV